MGNNSLQLLKRLWDHLEGRRRKQFIWLTLIVVLSTFAELLTIGAVLPFIAVATAPDRVYDLAMMQPLIVSLSLTHPSQLIPPLAVIFGILAVVAGATRLLLLWATTRLSFLIGSDLSNNIFRRTLYQNYAVHCLRNSSEIISGISTKTTAVIYYVINPVLMVLGAVVMLVAVCAALFMVDVYTTSLAFTAFGLAYLLISRVTRKVLDNNSNVIAKKSDDVVRVIQEALGGIRDILINGAQETYCDVYRESDLRLRQSQGSVLFVSQAPRYVMEAFGMALVALVVLLMYISGSDFLGSLPLLTVFAIGAQRLLPLLQQVFGNIAHIKGSYGLLTDTLSLLDQPIDYNTQGAPVDKVIFKDRIEIKDVSFRYADSGREVLRDITLSIPKGSCVGFVGATGCGKSTLVDIITGLLHPTTGDLYVDDTRISPANVRAWQVNVAQVSQTIYLSDGTIEENIAFGIPRAEIDIARVRLAADQAQLTELIENLPDRYQTRVGERGVRLSGGQRQRLGVARALYKRADVLVLDEATSALDCVTENSLMSVIERLSPNLTVLMIAHRISTLRNCDQIFELDAGEVRRVCSYSELIGR